MGAAVEWWLAGSPAGFLGFLSDYVVRGRGFIMPVGGGFIIPGREAHDFK